jgi:DNA-binding IclR family transcriptional regulator
MPRATYPETLPGSGTLSSYTAPALEKGLDILEHLASSPTPLSMSQLAQQMGRTVPELYRMVVVLSDRGYVRFDDYGIVATSKAFHLGLDRPDVQRLIEVAGPEMERLSKSTGQACYLTAADDREVVVISAQPAMGPFGLDIREGMRQPLIETAAGLVHHGFRADAGQALWLEGLKDIESEIVLAGFLKEADRAARSGQAERIHRRMDSLTEISSPVTDAMDRVFALSLLYLRHQDGSDLGACRSDLRGAARRVTQTLRFQRTAPGDHSRLHQSERPPEVCEP